MTLEQQERAKILMKATCDILNKCDEGPYVKSVFQQTAIWDEAECDGYCLHEELNNLLIEMGVNEF